jgi:hypothetical protein
VSEEGGRRTPFRVEGFCLSSRTAVTWPRLVPFAIPVLTCGSEREVYVPFSKVLGNGGKNKIKKMDRWVVKPHHEIL